MLIMKNFNYLKENFFQFYSTQRMILGKNGSKYEKMHFLKCSKDYFANQNMDVRLMVIF